MYGAGRINANALIIKKPANGFVVQINDWFLHTAWKMSKYGVFSCVNTRKYKPEKNSVFGHFSRSDLMETSALNGLWVIFQSSEFESGLWKEIFKLGSGRKLLQRVIS